MPYNQKITDFINQASARDFARDNLFRVVSINCKNLFLAENDLVFCKGANLSGREVPHAQVKYMGMELNYPQSTVKYPDAGEYKLTFYLDADSRLRTDFERASRYLFDNTNTSGDWTFPSIDDTLTLVSLDNQFEEIDRYTYRGVSIKSIDSIETKAAEGEGVALEISVTFTYLYYDIETIKQKR